MGGADLVGRTVIQLDFNKMIAGWMPFFMGSTFRLRKAGLYGSPPRLTRVWRGNWAFGSAREGYIKPLTLQEALALARNALKKDACPAGPNPVRWRPWLGFCHICALPGPDRRRPDRPCLFLHRHPGASLLCPGLLDHGFSAQEAGKSGAISWPLSPPRRCWACPRRRAFISSPGWVNGSPPTSARRCSTMCWA